MNILILGGSGFLGRHLCQTLLSQGHHVLVKTRSIKKTKHIFEKLQYIPTIIESYDDPNLSSTEINIVISLTGSGIVDKRWTTQRKQALVDSRIQPLLELKDWLTNNDAAIDKLLIGSAIGYYGFSKDSNQEFIESSDPFPHFVHDLCQQLETTSEQLLEIATNIVQLRTGVVLGKHGGALQKMLTPAKLHLNGAIGNGRQWVSWIHIQDWINAVSYILSLESPRLKYNLSSPQPTTNRQMSAAIASAQNKTFQLPIPAFSLKLLLGEASILLTGSQKVLPANLQAANFEFAYPNINSACQNLIHS